MYAGGQGRANGGDGGRDALLRRRRQPGAAAAAAATASSSSSGRGEEVEEDGGDKKQGRRKRQGKTVARAIRDRLPAAAASCWRGVSFVKETGGRRGRSRRRDSAADDGSGHGGDNSGEGGSSSGTSTAAAAWCCVCPAGDCSLESNPSANGKEDPGVRSLLERNDFFAADCNPHADGLPSSSSW